MKFCDLGTRGKLEAICSFIAVFEKNNPHEDITVNAARKIIEDNADKLKVDPMTFMLYPHYIVEDLTRGWSGKNPKTLKKGFYIVHFAASPEDCLYYFDGSKFMYFDTDSGEWVKSGYRNLREEKSLRFTCAGE